MSFDPLKFPRIFVAIKKDIVGENIGFIIDVIILTESFRPLLKEIKSDNY